MWFGCAARLTRDVDEREVSLDLVASTCGAVLIAGCTTDSETPRSHHPTRSSVTFTGSGRHLPVSLPWVVLSHPSPRTFNLVVAHGGCERFRHLSTTETPSAVRVEAVGTRIDAGDCPSTLGGSPVTMTLASDQAGRPVVHAPVAHQWDGPSWPRQARSLREMFESRHR